MGRPAANLDASSDRKRPGYCVRFERIVNVGGSHAGPLLLAWTTSSKTASRRWTTHSAQLFSRIDREYLVKLAEDGGMKVYGSLGDHPWFSWAHGVKGQDDNYLLMREAAVVAIEGALLAARLDPP